MGDMEISSTQNGRQLSLSFRRPQEMGSMIHRMQWGYAPLVQYSVYLVNPVNCPNMFSLTTLQARCLRYTRGYQASAFANSCLWLVV